MGPRLMLLVVHEPHLQQPCGGWKDVINPLIHPLVQPKHVQGSTVAPIYPLGPSAVLADGISYWHADERHYYSRLVQAVVLLPCSIS